jgi:hypothetical protein
MMPRLALGVTLLAGIALSAIGQSGTPQLPHVTLTVPPGIPPEGAVIDYSMEGPFGGRSELDPKAKEPGVYDIPAFGNGNPASRLKVIAYIPGCEIAVLKITVTATGITRTIPCVPLGSSLLRGQISPASITQGKQAEVEVSYLAPWAMNFFGYADGIVPELRVAHASVDETGHFELQLPDLYKQEKLGKAEFQFILRERGTGNILSFLSVDETSAYRYGLKIRPSPEPVMQLPRLLEFTPNK